RSAWNWLVPSRGRSHGAAGCVCDGGRRLRSAMVHDQPRPALTRQVGPYPLDEHADTEARLAEELEVHRGPHQPGDEPGEMHSSALQHGEALPNDRHGALVEVP